MHSTQEATFRPADIAMKKQKQKNQKKALDFPKLLNAPNIMIYLGLFCGAGGWVRPLNITLHRLKKAGSPFLYTHSGAKILNLL